MSDTEPIPAPGAAARPIPRGRWSEGGPTVEEELPFTRKPMVRWLDPKQLCGTAIRSVLSDVFGAYADQREMQAAITECGIFDEYAKEEEIWIDYVADLGDGFDSTYTVAWCLAQPELAVGPPDGGAGEAKRTLPRGRILVMGGDQVYPTASRDEYQNRMAGPYEAALPCLPDEEAPHLFAVPGNHDWYDGLTSFMRLLCQGRHIGGWKTRQTRSYFALKLPHGWWLLGTDLQLHADIDKPQLDYFFEVAKGFAPGDRVILCTPQPSWVDTPHEPTAFDNLAFFEQKVIADHGAELALTLTGDLHHYARYADAAGHRHKVTSGGGGAYLYGTHRLPRQVLLDRAVPEKAHRPELQGVRSREPFTERKVYPERGESRAMRFPGALLSFARNPWFSVVLAGFYTLFAWSLEAVSMRHGEATFQQKAAALGPGEAAEVLGLATGLVFSSPPLLFLGLFVVFALLAFCQPDPGRPAVLKWLGVVHGVAHLALGVGLAWAVAHLSASAGEALGGSAWSGPLLAGLFVGAMLLSGWLLGGLLMGLFLLPGVNVHEAFSAQHLSSYRNFLRLHLDRQGNLTVHPVGIRSSVPWRFRAGAPAGKPFFEPSGAAPDPRLIEHPFTAVPRHPASSRLAVPGLYSDASPSR